ncbi:uncharacterized protein LOC111863470 [Cryptotermes secundus]|uniref:uncharacterized protein LOC111863470 n=1 Tax=Cryptotermes secundus TaxID=105785 RepID=UPI000CD7CD36|nr:uncharacterized protein LOC111863470 [Cryptotermes secundus]XP_023705585.1 uncharacterized protein LOC111863470 [Cryptotermes secundus]
MFGVVAAIIIITVMLCCFCSCCILYKKRQPRLSGGPLYRMHCSSTASGVANMYSFSNPNSLATTPLDSALANSRLLVDLEPVVARSLSPTDSRATMAMGHTFSRDTRSAEMDLHANELGGVAGTRTEPPPPYNSSVNEQHPDRSVPLLSHGRSFSQQTFNPAGPLHSMQTSSSGAPQLESPVLPTSRIFPSTGTPLASCTTFVPSPTQPAATDQVTASTSVAATASGTGPVLLPASTSPLVTTVASRGHDALYHSTKF